MANKFAIKDAKLRSILPATNYLLATSDQPTSYSKWQQLDPITNYRTRDDLITNLQDQKSLCSPDEDHSQY